MGMLDSLLAQVSSNVDIANLASKVGIDPAQAEAAVQALGHAHHAPGDTVETAAANTGLPSDVLQQIIGHIGGEGSLGQFATLLQGQAGNAAGVFSALDKDGDGNPLNDIAGMAGNLFGSKS
ncbi:MAG: hypothetical protein K2P68_00580 [Sphingomonas sp.]|nr:hypothetical protein [Sphingomonas sp.]